MQQKFKVALRHPMNAAAYLFSKAYNVFIGSSKNNITSHLKELSEIQRHAQKRTDMSDHLVTFFTESLSIKPKLIVELGVRGGESNFVLERVANLCNSHMVSVDMEDCSNISSYDKWHFVQSDDITFAKKFKSWCGRKKIKPKIDVLFIDTSHQYEHTLEEIKHWFPFLSRKAKVFFHDTNLRNIYFRKDGSMGVIFFNWINTRDVIRALETYFNTSFNEKQDFVDYKDGWLIKHTAACCGFTILERIS